MTNSIIVPDDLIARCRALGADRIKSYPAHRRGMTLSMYGAETNAELQAVACMGECAFCLWAGLDPRQAVNWRADLIDGGWDTILWKSRVDIKTTSGRGNYLIWPFSKIHTFEQKAFDLLVLVRGAPPTFEIVGYTTKQYFREHHEVSDARHRLPHHGTWCMHRKALWDVGELLANDEPDLRTLIAEVGGGISSPDVWATWDRRWRFVEQRQACEALR